MSDDTVKTTGLTRETFMSRLGGRPEKEAPKGAAHSSEDKIAAPVSDSDNVASTLDQIIAGVYQNNEAAEDDVPEPSSHDPFDLEDGLFPPEPDAPEEPDEPAEPGEPGLESSHENSAPPAESGSELADGEEFHEPRLLERIDYANPLSTEHAAAVEEIAGRSGLRSIIKSPINKENPDADYEAYQGKVRMEAEKARKIMNTIATLGPIFKRVVGNAESHDAAGLVGDLLRRAESLQEKLYPIFNAKSDKEVPAWLKAQIARYSTDMVAENPSLSVDEIVSLTTDVASYTEDIRFDYSGKVDDRTQVKLSLVKAIGKIEREINDFHGKLMEANVLDMAERILHSRPAILNDVTNFLVAKVGEGMTKLSDPDAPRKSSTMMAQSLINQASEFYLSALSYELSLYWQRRGQHQKKGTIDRFAGNFLSRNKEGINTDAVKQSASNSLDDLISATTHEFDKQFNRLLNFTHAKIEDTVKNI